MNEDNATANQEKFINRLKSESKEREEAFRKFMDQIGKTELPELTFGEASSLIDELRKVRVENPNPTNLYLTGKQLDLITRLQDSEERQKAVREYLGSHGMDAVNFLHLTEASELIDILMKIPGTQKNSTGNATRKQVQFIKNLQDSDVKLEITSKYLKDLGRGSIDDLTVKEASALIDRLREAKVK